MSCHVSHLAFIVMTLGAPGCLVFRSQHDDLTQQAAELEKKVETRQKELDQSLSKADELQGKVMEAETLLWRSQTDLGMRVEALEGETQELLGRAENAEYVAEANNQELKELNTGIDLRLQALEQRLNEATNIPDRKIELLAAAERLFERKKYVKARRLYRTYHSRYPNDPKLPEIRFKIGLTYFGKRDYKSALGEFYPVIQDNPDAAVIPDALYYSGLCFAKLGQCANAIAYFEAIQEPQSKATDYYKQQAAKQIQILEKDETGLCRDRDVSSSGPAADAGSIGGRESRSTTQLPRKRS
jgi:TolA-binding protein